MARNRFSESFERDFSWYLRVRNEFSFDGALPDQRIVHDINGVSGKKAFHAFDSTGRMLPTRHPTMLRRLLKAKGSVNLHVKMYGEGIAHGLFTLHEIDLELQRHAAPAWVLEAVNNQRYKVFFGLGAYQQYIAQRHPEHNNQKQSKA